MATSGMRQMLETRDGPSAAFIEIGKTFPANKKIDSRSYVFRRNAIINAAKELINSVY